MTPPDRQPGLKAPPAGALPHRELQPLLTTLLQFAVAATHADAGAIYLYDEVEGDLVLRVGHRLPSSALGHRLGVGESLIGQVVSGGHSLVSGDVTRDPRARTRRFDWDSDPAVRSFLGTPLRTGAVTLGALELVSRRTEAFSIEQRGQTATFADAAALLIEQAKLRSEPPPPAMFGETAGGDPMGILTVDARLYVTSANPAMCRLLGGQLESVVGRPVLAVLPALGRPASRDALEAALHGTPAHLGATVLTRRTGHLDDGRSEVAANLSLIPLGEAAVEARGVMIVALDVSERNRLESELRQRHGEAVDARDRLRAVVEIVSHELRTPLTSVLGYAQLLLERPQAAPDQQQRWAAHIVDKARLMARLVEEVTDLARLGADRMEIRREDTDLLALLHQIATEVDAASTQHHIKVIADEQVPRVGVDPVRIEQVFVNLLTNAVKFWPEGGTVKIHVWPGDDAVRVDVIDQGVGVPEPLRGRIFDPFVRGGEEVRGSGLGLAIAKGIVEVHGGSLVHADNPGGGSIFSVRLPHSLA